MSWPQNYSPLGGLLPSALVAALPVAVLLVLLGVFHWKAHRAAIAGVAAALIVAVVAFKMPIAMAGAAAVYGAMFGLFPIG